eukprot:1072262-Pleurochrysis_carterae.AAC.1
MKASNRHRFISSTHFQANMLGSILSTSLLKPFSTHCSTFYMLASCFMNTAFAYNALSIDIYRTTPTFGWEMQHKPVYCRLIEGCAQDPLLCLEPQHTIVDADKYGGCQGGSDQLRGE